MPYKASWWSRDQKKELAKNYINKFKLKSKH